MYILDKKTVENIFNNAVAKHKNDDVQTKQQQLLKNLGEIISTFKSYDMDIGITKVSETAERAFDLVNADCQKKCDFMGVLRLFNSHYLFGYFTKIDGKHCKTLVISIDDVDFMRDYKSKIRCKTFDLDSDYDHALLILQEFILKKYANIKALRETTGLNAFDNAPYDIKKQNIINIPTFDKPKRK